MYYLQIQYYVGRRGDYCLTVEAIDEAANNDACDATDISLGQPCTGMAYTTFGTDRQAGEPTSCDSGPYTAWAKFTAPASGAVRITYVANDHSNIGLFSVGNCNDFGSFNQVTCNSGSNFSYDRVGLTPGQVYYLQIQYYVGRRGDYCLSIETIPPLTSDNACDATDIPLGQACQTLTTFGATRQTAEPAGCLTENATVWTKFTAPATSAVRFTVSKNNAAYFRSQLFAVGACGNFGTFASLACWEYSGNLIVFEYSGLTAGQVYYLQSAYSGNNVGNFCLKIEEIALPPANDAACNASLLTVGAACAGFTFSNFGATWQTGEPSGCANNSKTVWFKFVAPATGAVRVNFSKNSNSALRAGLFSVGDCASFPTYSLKACWAGGAATWYLDVLLNAGETYYIQVSFDGGQSHNFCLNVDEIPRAPNDDVCSATLLTLNQPCSGNPYTNVGSSRQSSEPSNCSGDEYTVWFKFTAPASGAVRVTADRGTSNQTIRVAMYGAANCSAFGGFALLRCVVGSQFYFDQVNLTAGAVYYFQVAFSSNATANFCLNVGEIPRAPNDDVCSATLLTLNQPCSGNPYTNVGSSRQTSEPNNCIGDDYTVWFKFTAPPSGAVRINGNKGTGPQDLRLSLYKATTCSTFSGFVYQGCAVGNQFDFHKTRLVPGAQYFIQASYNNNNTGNFCVSIDSLAIPTNDIACNAITLTPGVPCTGYPYTNIGTTRQSNEPTSCMLDSTVWFKFTAPASGKVRVNCDRGTGTQMLRVALYKGGNCNSFTNFTQEACQVGNQFYFEKDGLVAGSTYYLQVGYHNYTFGNFCIDVVPYLNYYKDNDDDGYGTGAATLALLSPNGYLSYASQNGDCNDANAAINPGATEICNNLDDDCDNLLDTNDPNYVDTIPPSITCPASQSGNTDAGTCTSSSIALGTAMATDNCQVGSVTHDAPSAFSAGTTTVTWTATDLKNNTATCVQTVVVQDVELPVLACPANATVNTDAGACTKTMAVAASASDNCGIADNINDAPAAFPVGTTTVLFTATDTHGNTATCVQTVTVSDAELPTITCPANIAQANDAGSCSASIAVAPATASDNCGIASNINDAPATFPIGNTTVTHTATDVHGNAATCTQTVTVNDTELPVITCPADLTVTAPAGICVADPNLGAATATDNCSGVSATNNAPPAFPIGIATVSWVATDASGGSASCAQSVTVLAPGTPETCNGLDDDCNGITDEPLSVVLVGQTNVPCGNGATGAADITPTCGLPPYTFLWSNGTTSEDLSGVWPGTYTVTVSDSQGLSQTLSVTILQSSGGIALTYSLVRPTCFGGTNGSVQANPTAPVNGYTYLWSTGATTRKITGVPAGSYTVTVTKTATGCTVIGTATLGNPAQIAITLKTISNPCFGNALGNITATATGGTGSKAFAWSTGASGPRILNLSAGAYTVTATDSKGCTNSASATLVDPPVLGLTHTIAPIAGGKFKVTLSATGGTPAYKYCRLVGSTCAFGSAAVFTNLLPNTTYVFRARDAKQCIAEITVTTPTSFGQASVRASADPVTVVRATPNPFANQLQLTVEQATTQDLYL